MAINKFHRRSIVNRDRIDIVASILEAANGGVTRRRILLKAGLSNNQFKRYVRALIKEGYMTIKSPGRKGRPATFLSTDRGLTFLLIYSEIKKLL